MAAVLACGDGAMLSHRSAAELWGIGHEGVAIDLTVRRKCEIRRKGLKVRSRPSLDARSFVRPPRHPGHLTGADADRPRHRTEPLRLERAVNEADKLDLVDPETLRRALDAHKGEPGVKKLATLLDRHTFRLSDSDLEVLFRPLALAAGLPAPLTKHRVLGYEADFFFPDHDLIVETDGLRYHRTPAQQARAARRDQTHTAAGLRVLRFTHWQITHEPDEVTNVLRRLRPHLPK